MQRHFTVRQIQPLLVMIIFLCSLHSIFANELDHTRDDEATLNDDDYDIYSNINSYCAVYDPWEGFNRKVFYFNGVIDTIVMRPIAKTYDAVTTDYMKARVGSFASNVYVPVSTVNYAMQGNSEGVHKSFWRFFLNTTVGIGGLFDVASKFGMSPKTQTFGSTLAHYGVGPGPYIVLPIFGGSNMRHVTDNTVTNFLFNPLYYAMHQDFTTINNVVSSIHYRSMLLPFTDYVSKNSLDPYVTIRNSIHQKSEGSVHYPQIYKCPSVNKKS